ncbi:MAG TPA: 16S rRNA (cytosine(1402)-N(4))-methyltransferase RsmH [Candidatus Acidoferrales bacterium]|nr:16S rRNA (cytosine(1402)-N(4))-methyltransferase RsmH [Candidatus Acidoferrales bacterium]
MLEAAGGGREKVFVDATFGAGGHTRALLEAAGANKVVALDADPAAVDRARVLARRYPGRVKVAHANFGELDDALDRAHVKSADGFLFDLGLSSLQLAQAGRGFAFSGDDPLDMRLDPSSDVPTASDLLARLPQAELERILREHGDEHHARAIARAIVRRRPRVASWSTSDLVAAVLEAFGPRRRHQRIHPATRTFLALRIAVNGELRALERGLESAVRRLRPGGHIAVISYHSGEDRIVKHRFKSFAQSHLAEIVTRKPMRPSIAEVKANPRSRSAKLRVVASPRDGRSA